jgi:hypothetical protein
MAAPRLAQQIRVRPVGDAFAFVSVVVHGWSVHGVRVRGDRIEWPESEKNGRRYPIVTPPPEIREQLEQEIAAALRAGHRPGES